MPFSSVITMVWLGEHRAFFVECFIKTESYVAVQCAFRKKIKLRRHDLVPTSVTISKFVKTLTSFRIVRRQRSSVFRN